MAEYIAREVLLAQLRAMESYNVSPMYRRGYDDCVEAILKAPAADVVPVVRCKDCKWFVDNNGGEWYGCKMFQVVRITPEDAPKPDDFCSYGERRDGDTDNGV
jgi:hypothetical protein